MKRVRHFFALFLTTSLTIVFAGCGGNSTKTPSVTVTAINLSTTAGSVAAGRTVQLTATATYSNNTTGNLSGATWTSSNSSVATVDASGLVTTKAPGTATITVTYNGVSGTYTITVTAATLQSFSFSTTNFSLVLGRTQSLTLSGTMSDGTAASSSSFSSCTWSSSSTGVATLSPSTGASSTVSAAGTGTSTITVTCGTVVQTTTVTVTPATVVSIAVTPANPSIDVGATQPFTATATMSDSTTQNVTSTATWSSSNHSYATMDAVTPGLAHGVAAGTSTITASQGGIDGTTLLTVTSSAGEAPWTRLLGSVAADFGYAVARDTSDNVYITGMTSSNFDDQIMAGFSDAFIAKYDSSGTRQWIKLLGSLHKDSGQAIALDASGNVYIAGFTNGNLDGQTNAGLDNTPDAFIAKYDSSGNKQWVKTIGTYNDDYASGIAVDASGNIYVAGSAGIFPDEPFVGGSTDIFIAKYDSAGNRQWLSLLGSTLDDYIKGMALDSSGNIYVTGDTNTDLDGQTNAGLRDGFIAKFDASGTKQWARLLGTTDDDFAYAIAVDASDNVYIGGSTLGNLGGQTNAGIEDAFIAKYDSSGTRQWVKLLGSDAYDSLSGIAFDASGDAFITGATSGNLNGQTNAGARDVFIARLDSDGAPQWVKLLGSPTGDNASGIVLGASGNIYIVGATVGNLNGQTNAGSADIFLVKAAANGSW